MLVVNPKNRQALRAPSSDPLASGGFRTPDPRSGCMTRECARPYSH